MGTLLINVHNASGYIAEQTISLIRVGGFIDIKPLYVVSAAVKAACEPRTVIHAERRPVAGKGNVVFENMASVKVV